MVASVIIPVTAQGKAVGSKAMKTLDKYVLKEMIAPFMISMFAFVVLLIGRVIFDNIDQMIKLGVPLGLAARLIAFRIPWVMGMVLPLAVLFATSLCVNRLARDGELTAIRMAGTPLRRIFMSIFAVGFACSLLALWFGERVTPWANRESERTIRTIYGMQAIPIIQEQVFFESEGYWFYVGRVERPSREKTILRDVMIYEPSPAGFPTLITAAEASNEKNLWTLRKGVMHKLGKDGVMQYEMSFPSMQLNLRRIASDLWETQRTSEEMSLGDLKQQISAFGGLGRDVREMQVNWHFKLAIPLSCLVFALCAAPLGLRFARSGSYSGILLGIIVMFLYQNNIWLGKALGMGGMVPPFLAGWSQNIVFGLIGIYLIWREE